ncbi:hydroxyproline dehydrogenase isoform X1 [Pseudoliparis swirei]|uniref:hydroxyproline dehydrogenase isoform X1 n=1 Tax=Pseudoliparis swirei TaxID=2059687 RepID=UPI0024BEFD11|nr:hydroxyproline dehydrogenase isoform X1 [Pseudoliparis swirei]
MSRWRPSLPHVSSLRLLGSSASRTAAVQRPGRLSAALAFEESGAFGVKSLGELLRALCIFQLCSFPVLVNNCGKLLTVARALLGRRGFSLLLRPTVYAQFVAGENESEISRSMEKMSSLGLRPMLAVPIEEDLGESAGEKRYDDNMEAMLECVRMSHRNAWSKEPMMQLKVTALLSPDLCVKVTTLISRQPYDLNLLVRAMDGEPIEFPGLNESEVAHFLCGLQRLNKIAEASVNKVRVLVDAEYTYMNPTLSLVTMAMMKKFNKDDAWIWNTYQCYLKESGSLLAEALRLSSDEGFCLGVKLVRGAYMDKERKLAEKEGRLDPVHQRWEDTNDSYNGSLDLMLEAILQKPERRRMIVATHNEESNGGVGDGPRRRLGVFRPASGDVRPRLPHAGKGGLCGLQVSAVRLGGRHAALLGASGSGESHRIAGNPQREEPAEERALQKTDPEERRPIGRLGRGKRLKI